MKQLSQEDLNRYSRQLTIPGFGAKQQQRLKNSSALVTRAGGLGGPVALYLAAAGIGGLTVVHGDLLGVPDLNRQILMTDDWVGKPRPEKITESIHRLNPTVELRVIGENITAALAEQIVPAVDIVCDCPPTFEERYLLNDAIVEHRKPMIEAAMNGMESHLTVLVPGQTPCLRCLYPEANSWWSGTEFPVMGAVSGALGCLAAIETIKVLTQFGVPLVGKLLAYDTQTHEYRKYKVRRDLNCVTCGHLGKN